MSKKILVTVSERGQITIPKKIRNQVAAEHFFVEVKNGNIILKPLKTKEEFVAQLEEEKKAWSKSGGVPLNNEDETSEKLF